ncbi:MAG: transcription termination/antitermination NusG family protein [Candidatus Methylomirabilales bacterium]
MTCDAKAAHPPKTCWYALQTKPRKEPVVTRQLEEMGVECFFPRLRQRRRVGPRRVWVNDPLFPGYLFVALPQGEALVKVRYLHGVKDFVRFGPEPTVVEPEVIAAIRARCPNGIAELPPQPLSPGQRVLITDGPLAGLEAVFVRELSGQERVELLLRTLSYQASVRLPRDLIRPLGSDV